MRNEHYYQACRAIGLGLDIRQLSSRTPWPFIFLILYFFLFRNKSVLEYNRGIIFNDGKDSNSLIMLEQGV